LLNEEQGRLVRVRCDRVEDATTAAVTEEEGQTTQESFVHATGDEETEPNTTEETTPKQSQSTPAHRKQGRESCSPSSCLDCPLTVLCRVAIGYQRVPISDQIKK
jgi:hypothetical protein